MANIVREHIKFFSESNGKITSECIEDAHTSQCIFKGVSVKARAICNIMGDNPHNIETLEKTLNPSSTGIWKPDGTFDEDEFNKLVNRGAFASSLGYKRIITKQNFLDHLQERHGKKNTGIACYILKFIPVSWKCITNGSIDELFEYYSDAVVNNEKVFTETRLREFYTNPNKVMAARIERVNKGENLDDNDMISYCNVM
jgi:hypothetical protein